MPDVDAQALSARPVGKRRIAISQPGGAVAVSEDAGITWRTVTACSGVDAELEHLSSAPLPAHALSGSPNDEPQSEPDGDIAGEGNGERSLPEPALAPLDITDGYLGDPPSRQELAAPCQSLPVRIAWNGENLFIRCHARRLLRWHPQRGIESWSLYRARNGTPIDPVAFTFESAAEPTDARSPSRIWLVSHDHQLHVGDLDQAETAIAWSVRPIGPTPEPIKALALHRDRIFVAGIRAVWSTRVALGPQPGTDFSQPMTWRQHAPIAAHALASNSQALWIASDVGLGHFDDDRLVFVSPLSALDVATFGDLILFIDGESLELRTLAYEQNGNPTHAGGRFSPLSPATGAGTGLSTPLAAPLAPFLAQQQHIISGRRRLGRWLPRLAIGMRWSRAAVARPFALRTNTVFWLWMEWR